MLVDFAHTLSETLIRRPPEFFNHLTCTIIIQTGKDTGPDRPRFRFTNENTQHQITKTLKTSTRNRGRRRCMKSTIAAGMLSMGCLPHHCVTNKDGQLQRGEQALFAAYFTHESRELKSA